MPEIGIPVTLETPRGNLVFNSGDLRLTEFTTQRAVRSSIEPIPQRHGSIVLPAYFSGATAILKGQIKVGVALGARSAAMQELSYKTASILDADGYLRWTPTDFLERRLPVRLLEDLQIGGSLVKDFQIALASERSQAEGVSEQVLTDNTSPYSVSPAGGDVDSYPTIKVTGPIIDPVISRTSPSLKTLSFSGLTVAAGQFLTIDTFRETAVLNTGASVIDKLVISTSEFWTIASGANTVTLTGSGTTAATTLEVRVRMGWAL